MRAAVAFLSVLLATVAVADPVSPFDPLLGRWVGEGRLGFTGGKSETVKCRVTYIRAAPAPELRQTLRCAAPSGSVEVQSAVVEQGGVITGTWRETNYNLTGDVTGQTTKHGFRVEAKGADFAANMDIIVRGGRHVIEIKFRSESLIGLTLVLSRG